MGVRELLHVNWLTVLGLLLAINGVTILSFWADTRRAIERRYRIPEGNLLMLALIGGTPGALAARHVFRHKTRKQPFSALLYATALGQVALLGWVAFRFA